ncbi:MAG: branched-chain amino acid ABC transporter permease [Bacteroidetes bacterium]|nr:branched-chain amino acid ABC transporter permease [Bacteroidota bacterium]
MMLGRVNDRTEWLLVGALVVVLAVIPLLGNAYYTSVLIIIGIHAIVTVGLCLLMGYAGQVSLGGAAFYGIGAYISGILSGSYGVSPWIALAIAAVATGLLAWLVGYPIFRLRGNYLAMATLGFGIIVNILFVELRQIRFWIVDIPDLTGGPAGLPRPVPPLAIGSFVFDSDFSYYYLVWAFCLALLLLARNIVRSRTGRALQAIHTSEEAAASLGIDVAQLKVKVFVLSAMYASLAGSLYAHYVAFVSPQPFGFLFSIQLVVMAVVGGLASIWGAVLGAATVRILGEVLHPFGNLDVIVFGLVLMAVIMFLPEGLNRGLARVLGQWRTAGVSTRVGAGTTARALLPSRIKDGLAWLLGQRDAGRAGKVGRR